VALIKDCTEGKFQEITNFVAENVQYEKSFDQCIDQLARICENNPGYVCELYPDWAPHSMTFLIHKEEDMQAQLLHGGLIFHGNPDESLSVTLEPCDGFRIHT